MYLRNLMWIWLLMLLPIVQLRQLFETNLCSFLFLVLPPKTAIIIAAIFPFISCILLYHGSFYTEYFTISWFKHDFLLNASYLTFANEISLAVVTSEWIFSDCMLLPYHPHFEVHL